MKPKLLFVDDEPHVLASMERVLRSHRAEWDASFVTSPLEAWDRIQAGQVDLLVSDLNMPELSGLELLGRITFSERATQLPVIIVTGLGERTLRRQALELGATDLLSKPVDTDDLIARIRNALRLKAYQDELKNYNEVLEKRVQQRTAQLARSRLSVICRLAKAAEYRDEDTGNHVIRVGYYCRAIASALGLDKDFVETLLLTAPLHDIGKIGIPDAILLKPGKLAPEEWVIMKQHCEIGARILEEDLKSLPIFEGCLGLDSQGGQSHQPDPLLHVAGIIALNHHEKWNGQGYPRNLSGAAIPLEARIVAVSDVFDALTSVRPYKPAFSDERALAIIREGIGQHFDPEVAAAFEVSFDEIRAVRADFSDPQTPPKTDEHHETCLVCG